MSRLIDLGDVLAVINASMLNLEYTDENRAMQKAISMLPTVDAEPVVRCKDCKFASLTYDGECKYCQRWKEKYDGESVSLYLDGDFYCAWGERREDETD